MRLFEVYLSGALLLILVYLALSSSNTNRVLQEMGNVNVGAIKALQGRG